MQITIHGAGGGEVTGSAYLVQTDAAKALVDFGLFQGAKKLGSYNRAPAGDLVRGLDAVVLTHAHLDHTGRLPLLTRAGYQGPLYATQATIDLTGLILRDSAHLQQADVERENRRRRREGRSPVEPLYTAEDTMKLRPLARPMNYDSPTEVAPGIVVRAVDAGHVLGSASLEMAVTEGDRKRVVVFSGDLGPRGAPLHRDPTPFRHADLVFMESTYGERDHKPLHETAVEAREAVRKTVEAGGKVLVPVFAIGRTQLLLYLLAGAFRRGTLPRFPVIVDSPMAIEATNIYRDHVELFDEEALAMQRSGELATNLETAEFAQTADDSRALNDREGPLLIMAGAGMCNGGRILHHLRHNLARPNTIVLVVGYQSHGSLGRLLVDGKEVVTIFGEKIPVRASVHTFGGLSGHAGQKDLLRWFDTLAPSRPRVALTHGEDRGRKTLGRLIEERHRLKVEYPDLGDTLTL
jgi:metallo-beta-lactamase family protein